MREGKIRNFCYACFRRVCKKLQYSRISRYKLIGRLYDNVLSFLRPFDVSLENVAGHKMILDLRDGTCKMMSQFDFEPATGAALKEQLKPGMTFIDIGAHVGYFTLLGAKCVGCEGKVYAFEPVVRNFDMLKTNVELNGYTNVSLVRMAASDKNGSRTMRLSVDSAFHSLKLDAGKNSEIVKTITIDHFCRRHKIGKVDVVKLDVEGGELDALKGMKNTIRRNKELTLIVEYIPGNLIAIGSSPRKFANVLRRLGFNEFILLHEREMKPISLREIIGLKDDIYNILAKKNPEK